MPQLTLTLSKNIDLQSLNLDKCFSRIHEALQSAPKIDVHTIHSGVIQEVFSYIGFNNPKATKVYLQLYWMESPERRDIRQSLGNTLLEILGESIVPDVQNQGLVCIPRVRIANLGELNQSYFIHQ